ncbi:MAG TPA: flavodoxin domain-containing protein [Bacilli bacterium]|nr:flavodoxin domain-containing protein [Bacilli bacterium]
MKKLLVYTSKTGTTKKCTNMIKDSINNLTIIDLDKQNINIDDYDIILIGSPIRMGMISKKIKKFINNNYNILLTKKIAFFICCGFDENMETYYSQNIPKDLLAISFAHTSFGGEMEIEKQKGFDKFIANMVSKKDDRKPSLNNSNIDSFITKIKEIDK